MSSQCFSLNINRTSPQKANLNDAKPLITKEKIMSYEEKSVGSTPFFKCEACPYMALAEDDIKFHLFTFHPDLAKNNGLADNIQIPCPGCPSIFNTEETIRNHLRNHHKMGLKDVKKMVKSLVHIALKNAKLKKKDFVSEEETGSFRQDPSCIDMKLPELIKIVPDSINNKIDTLPKGVAFISVDELQKMSTPNFEKVDPKEIIQEASINIVYTNEVQPQYMNANELQTPNCNLIQIPNVTPDLISSIQPRISSVENCNMKSQSTEIKSDLAPYIPSRHSKVGRPKGSRNCIYKDRNLLDEKLGKLCSVNGCSVRLKDAEKLKYHRKCHQKDNLNCPECGKININVEPLHTHLWKAHAIDMELPTCEICGYKTYKRHRLHNIHMKCHGNVRSYTCLICSKSFKNVNQLSKHRMIHKRDYNPIECTICQREFSNERRLKMHMSAVHEKLKPFKCGHCDYTAARKEEMKLHCRSHTGDKPYSCSECSYRASDHNAMRRHKQVHTKESLYKCKYCPYTSIQSTVFACHMISKHPNITSDDVHCCPYCQFKSVNKDNYIVHLTTHTDKESLQALIEMTKAVKLNKPRWTIPSDSEEKTNEDTKVTNEKSQEHRSKAVNTIPIEVYDCDSLSESLPLEYPKKYFNNSEKKPQNTHFNRDVITDISKDDNNSDCLISESSNDVILENQQFTSQHPLQDLSYNNSQSNLHDYITMDKGLRQNNDVMLLSPNLTSNSNINNSIMNNFPIRLPPAPQLVQNNVPLTPVDKISLPMNKVIGPIIKPTQILPVPSASNSPVNIPSEPEGLPRKKPKISVKSNLILKGPDEVNIFHSQQKMAFRRLEDNERFGLGSPVTFNNLITTQFMQLQSKPSINDSPNIIPYSQETILDEVATTPEDNRLDNNSQMFSFNQQISSLPMHLTPPQKLRPNDPSYIKMENTIKQNTQSPILDRMCNVNIVYEASPSLEDIHKNIKNEVKSDGFYHISLNDMETNPSLIEQYLLDNSITEQYNGHTDLPNIITESDDQQNDIIEIDDNSEDNKILRYDMNLPLEPLYLMHNDFHFLENEIGTNNLTNEIATNDITRIMTEIPIENQKQGLCMIPSEIIPIENSNLIQGKRDPMMNTPVRPSINKINVKNIESMKK